MGSRGDGAGSSAPAEPRIARALLLAAGSLLGVASIAYAPWLLSWLRGAPLPPLVAEKVTAVRLGFALAGLAALAASEAVRRTPRLRRLAARPGATLALLVGLSLAVPLALLDSGLRPFVEPKTTLFVEDAELGWALRPGAVGEWGGVRVAINAQGRRGPVLARAKPAGAVRVLHLGDSVAFGYGLERAEWAYPFVTGERLAARRGDAVETLDFGVGGYSPWQQRIQLERDGLAYEPDLVVLGFVLNDVIEKLALVRYGGSERGWQLARSARSAADRWLSASAVATFLRGELATLRFGADVQAGALRAESAMVRRLAAGDADPVVRRAWTITFENLDAIDQLARGRGVPLLIAVFPYAFQLDAPEESRAPQRRVLEHAARQGIPAVDLLPVFADARRAGDGPLFLDASHPSRAGHALAARAIAERIEELALLPGGPR